MVEGIFYSSLFSLKIKSRFLHAENFLIFSAWFPARSVQKFVPWEIVQQKFMDLNIRSQKTLNQPDVSLGSESRNLSCGFVMKAFAKQAEEFS